MVIEKIVNARQKREPRSAGFGTSANLTNDFYAFGPATQDTAGNTPAGQWTDLRKLEHHHCRPPIVPATVPELGR